MYQYDTVDPLFLENKFFFTSTVYKIIMKCLV
jgi:hypothetical protein